MKWITHVVTAAVAAACFASGASAGPNLVIFAREADRGLRDLTGDGRGDALDSDDRTVGWVGEMFADRENSRYYLPFGKLSAEEREAILKAPEEPGAIVLNVRLGAKSNLSEESPDADIFGFNNRSALIPEAGDYENPAVTLLHERALTPATPNGWLRLDITSFAKRETVTGNRVLAFRFQVNPPDSLPNTDGVVNRYNLQGALHPENPPFIEITVPSEPGVIELAAKETLTAIEMRHGDTLRFALKSGEVRTLLLEDTSARVIEEVGRAGIIYEFRCHLRVEDQPVELVRYASAQEAFYEPYVINGLRIWPIVNDAVFELLPHGPVRLGNRRHRPRKDARFAIQDATMRICPEETRPWMDEKDDFIDVERTYLGAHTYLGPYVAYNSFHRGLDINHPAGSLLMAPIHIDAQERIGPDDRWRGIRRWENGDVWALQSHHIIDLLVSLDDPVARGTPYATAAGSRVGAREHSHFVFALGRPRPGKAFDPDPASAKNPIDFDDPREEEVFQIDPWILFWQTFEDRKRRGGGILADMRPPGPARTGGPVRFLAEGSRAPADGSEPGYYWTFGDGGWATGENPVYRYARPGIYPVTLVVTGGGERATRTMHLTVGGDPVEAPALALEADAPSFRLRPSWVTDVYGWPVREMPNTLRFRTHHGARPPAPRQIWVKNIGGGELGPLEVTGIDHDLEHGWLRVEVQGTGNSQVLSVEVDPRGLNPGTREATVRLAGQGTLNPHHGFRVEFTILGEPPPADQTIGTNDPEFYATPYFWVGHRLARAPAERSGHNGFYLTNGERAQPGEFVRFSPFLTSGTYRVFLPEETPVVEGSSFNVRVRHAGGEEIVRVRPDNSRLIGTFAFKEEDPGFVEILAEESEGLVVADAMRFVRLDRASGGAVQGVRESNGGCRKWSKAES